MIKEQLARCVWVLERRTTRRVEMPSNGRPLREPSETPKNLLHSMTTMNVFFFFLRFSARRFSLKTLLFFIFQKTHGVKSKLRRPPATNRCKLTNAAHWFSVGDFTVSRCELFTFSRDSHFSRSQNYSRDFSLPLSRVSRAFFHAQKSFSSIGIFLFFLLCTRKLEVYWLFRHQRKWKVSLPTASCGRNPFSASRSSINSSRSFGFSLQFASNIILTRCLNKCSWAEEP